MVYKNSVSLASDLTFDSIVDGPGLRMVLWTQGCPHHCVGCHNPQTHDITKGIQVKVSEIIKQIQQSNLQTGLTLSGGEPFLQANQLLDIVEAAKQKGLNIWVYSGFTFEQLLQNPIHKQLLDKVDILVDGKYMEEKKDYRLVFKGSSNQRIIDVQSSLINNETIIYTL